MHLQNCRCFQEHLRMLLQSLRSLCFAPGGPGSIWNYLGALVRSTGVFGRFPCGFQTDLHFADAGHWMGRHNGLRRASSASAKCKLGQKLHANLPDTPVDVISASKYSQMLPGPLGAKQSAFRLCKSILRYPSKHLQLLRRIWDALIFDL